MKMSILVCIKIRIKTEGLKQSAQLLVCRCHNCRLEDYRHHPVRVPSNHHHQPLLLQSQAAGRGTE